MIPGVKLTMAGSTSEVLRAPAAWRLVSVSRQQPRIGSWEGHTSSFVRMIAGVNPTLMCIRVRPVCQYRSGSTSTRSWRLPVGETRRLSSPLFREVQPRLVRYLRTLGGADAEDVAAETWVQVVRGLARFSGDARGFRGWVFTIGHARMVDAWRAGGRRPETVSDTLPDRASEPRRDPCRRKRRDPATGAGSLLGELPEACSACCCMRAVAWGCGCGSP